MKKIIGLIFILLTLLMSFVSTAQAQDTINLYESDGNLGDIDFKENIKDMSLWNRIKYELSGGFGFTLIGGATCSAYPDYSWQVSVTSDVWFYGGETGQWIKYTNNDHVGVAFQLFEETSSGWKFLGEKQLVKGASGQFFGTTGKRYNADLYYCDDTTSERSCVDSDGGKDYYDYGKVTYTLGSDTQTFTDRCMDSNTLQERYCDSDNSPQSVNKACNCENGECVTLDSYTTTDVTFSNIAVQNDGKLVEGQVYYITGKAKISGECNDCIIETGLDEYGTALSILESDTGACGDDKTTGIKFNANDGDTIEFKLWDKATKTGNFKVDIGAYNGCWKDLGDGVVKYDSETFTLDIAEQPPEQPPESGVIDNTEDGDTTNDITCYSCMGTKPLTAVFDTTCGDAYVEEEMTCGDVPPNPCENVPTSTACEISPNPLPTPPNPIIQTDDLELKWWEEYFDFENNPAVAYSLSALILGIFIMIGYLILGTGGKKR